MGGCRELFRLRGDVCDLRTKFVPESGMPNNLFMTGKPISTREGYQMEVETRQLPPQVGVISTL